MAGRSFSRRDKRRLRVPASYRPGGSVARLNVTGATPSELLLPDFRGPHNHVGQAMTRDGVRPMRGMRGKPRLCCSDRLLSK